MFRRACVFRCAAAASSSAPASSSSSSAAAKPATPTPPPSMKPATSSSAASTAAAGGNKSVVTTATKKSALANWQETHLVRIGQTLDQVLNNRDADEISTLPIVSSLEKPLVPVIKPRQPRPSDETPCEPPPRSPTPRWVLSLAADHHHGLAVYKTRKDVISVLQALRVSKPTWWCQHCDDVLARMLALGQPASWDIGRRRGAIITVDGLDAVGKSTVTRTLASESNNLASRMFFDKRRDQQEQQHPSSLASSSSSSSSSSLNEESRAAEAAAQKEQDDRDEQKAKLFEKEVKTRIPGAVLIRTPSADLEPARQKFRSLEDPIARVFYSAANYLAAEDVVRNAQDHVVVLDRWWCSTAAMALAIRSKHLINLADQTALRDGASSHYQRNSSDFFAGNFNSDRATREEEELLQMLTFLPDEGSDCYEWPVDLPPVDLRLLLDCDEDTRTGRMAKRGDENAEERELAEKAALRATAREAYRRMYPPLETVMVPNYAAAVNQIIDLLEQRGLTKYLPDGHPQKFDDEFVASLTPY